MWSCFNCGVKHNIKRTIHVHDDVVHTYGANDEEMQTSLDENVYAGESETEAPVCEMCGGGVKWKED